MRQRMLALAVTGSFFLLAGCQASVSPNAATKTSFDRVYEVSPSVNSFVNKAYFTQRPRRVAVLPFVYRPRPYLSDGGAPELLEEGSEVGSPKDAPRPSPEDPGGGPLVTVVGDRSAPGGFSPDAELVRRAFYGQFATLAFSDVDIHEVDRKLKEEGIVTPRQLESADPKRLGSLLGADAVIYGTVHEISVAYLVMYSQIAVGLSLKMVSAADGEVLWQVDDVGRKHSFHFAMGPVGLVSGAVRNALALRPINVTRTAEDLSRDIVQTFPTRASLAQYSDDPYEILAVEADGHSETMRYGDVVSVRVTATPNRRVWFDLAPLARNVGLREVEPGLYKGGYAVQEGDLADDPTLTVFLGPKDSPQYYHWVQKRLDVAVDTIPPHPPKGLRTRGEGRGLLVLWEPSPSLDLREYRLYRKGHGGEVELMGTTDSTTYFLGATDPANSALVVTAVDTAGNESAGVEVALPPWVSGIGPSGSR